ncbi:MAG: hypothetical protein [Bacteriophage sp.]|nr:MAG: hypothetical protein [Bacteriophage sp.]
MKITYKTNVLDVIRLVENNTPALWKKEWNNFPNTWGGVNALTKKSCKRLINFEDLKEFILSKRPSLKGKDYRIAV